MEIQHTSRFERAWVDTGSPASAPTRFCGGAACRRALCLQCTLPLGYGPHNGQKPTAGGGRRLNVLASGEEVDPAVRPRLDDCQKGQERAGEAAEFRDHDGSARADIRPELLPPGPLRAHPTHPIRTALLASDLLEGIELRVQLLIWGTDTGIADCRRTGREGHQRVLMAAGSSTASSAKTHHLCQECARCFLQRFLPGRVARWPPRKLRQGRVPQGSLWHAACLGRDEDGHP